MLHLQGQRLQENTVFIHCSIKRCWTFNKSSFRLVRRKHLKFTFKCLLHFIYMCLSLAIFQCHRSLIYYYRFCEYFEIRFYF